MLKLLILSPMKQLSNLISELENKCKPERILVTHGGKDYEVYPWIKPFLFSVIQTGIKPNSGDTSMWFQLKKLFSGWSLFFKKHKTIIISNSLERRSLDGDVYDKLFHYISTQKALNPSMTIESKFPSNHYPVNEYKNPVCASRSIFFLKELLYRLFFVREVSVKGASLLKDFILDQGINIDINHAVRKNIAQYKVMYRFFKRRPEVKFVFLTVSYTNFGLIKACKELGIKVIEVQHGVINSEHYGYNYYYKPSQNQFPDYLLTLGDADCDFFKKKPLAHFFRVESIGSFIIEYYSKQNKNYFKGELNKRRVVVSLQDCETGISAVSSFIKLAELNPEVEFYFKRRRIPIDYYRDKFNFPKNILFENHRNIYELIVSCDIHLTAYSSCALEAPSLGVRNIFLNSDNKAKQYYLDKLPEGSINAYCDNEHEMHVALNEYILNKLPAEEIKESNNQNLKNNYFNNIDSFLENHILNEG